MSSAGIESIYNQPITPPYTMMLTMMLYGLCLRHVVWQCERVGAGSKPAFYGNMNV